MNIEITYISHFHLVKEKCRMTIQRYFRTNTLENFSLIIILNAFNVVIIEIDLVCEVVVGFVRIVPLSRCSVGSDCIHNIEKRVIWGPILPIENIDVRFEWLITIFWICTRCHRAERIQCHVCH